MTAPVEVSEEDKKLHADLVAEIHKREVSSSENFDKSVMTFSSAGLALSIGFLKDFVPIQDARWPYALYLSWCLFTLATCATMFSFLVSSLALAEQKKLVYAYYIEGDDTAFERANGWDRRTRCLNYASGAAFVLAMILSVAFISINLERATAMKLMPSQRPPAGHAERVEKGLPVPSMQKVPRAPAQPAPGQSAPTSPPPLTAPPSRIAA